MAVWTDFELALIIIIIATIVAVISLIAATVFFKGQKEISWKEEKKRSREEIRERKINRIKDLQDEDIHLEEQEFFGKEQLRLLSSINRRTRKVEKLEEDVDEVDKEKQEIEKEISQKRKDISYLYKQLDELNKNEINLQEEIKQKEQEILKLKDLNIKTKKNLKSLKRKSPKS